MDGWRRGPEEFATSQHPSTTSSTTSQQWLGEIRMSFSDLLIGVAGFFLRVIVNEYGLQYIPVSLHIFLIPSRYSLKSLRECRYLLNLNHPEKGIMDELVANCPSSIILSLISPLLSHPYLCLFVSTLLQYFIYLFLRQKSHSVGLFFWFNPISVISALLSPLTSIHQFLISLLIQLFLASSSSILLLPPIALLLASDFSQCLPMILSLLPLHYSQQNLSETAKKSAPHQKLILLALLLIAILLSMATLLDGSHIDGLFLNSPLRHFQPGPGILWYLQGQMFPEYTAYFAWFVSFQPYITSLLLLFRLEEINPLATVCSIHLLPFPQ
jgi:hypothetical protein